MKLAILIVSDSRTAETDTSGRYLRQAATEAGHDVLAHQIVPDDISVIRAALAQWQAGATVEAVLVSGGTGITGRDVTPEAVEPLFTRALPGFGELFRWLSYADIGASTIQSRACAGLIGTLLVFCLPGSQGACRLAWEKILRPQLDVTTMPCNFATLLPRLSET
ncbi:MAG: molybdenum cofactor biosynthesis protein B [Oceanococcaceae bacterium]